MGEEKKHHAGSSHHAGGENKHHHESNHEEMKVENHEGQHCGKEESCCNSVFSNSFGLNSNGELSKEEASQKALAFVNGNLMQGGQTAVIKSVDEENNMYTMKLQVGAQEFSTYLSKDGQLFFPQGLKIDGSADSTSATNDAPSTDVPKTAKPEVEFYVFTYCPFGVQMEKAAAPVVKLLGNKVDFK